MTEDELPNLKSIKRTGDIFLLEKRFEQMLRTRLDFYIKEIERLRKKFHFKYESDLLAVIPMITKKGSYYIVKTIGGGSMRAIQEEGEFLMGIHDGSIWGRIAEDKSILGEK